MTGLALCAVAFILTYALGRRSVPLGMSAVLTVGFLYGIVRANYLDSFTHFLFDSSVFGLYLVTLIRPGGAQTPARLRPLQQWVLVLLGWAAIMFILPLQHPLIQLVGLRGNAFLVPFLLLGSRLQFADAQRIARWLAVLNLVALGFAGAEYLLGIERFYPVNSVTELIYKSNDVSNYTSYRIPACFVNAHAYAGAMVASLPWLFGCWLQPGKKLEEQLLFIAGIVAALMGVFMSATRLNIGVLALMILLSTFSGRLRGGMWLGWIIVLAGVGYVVSSEERFQRFLNLQDTDRLMVRIRGSVNMTFFDLLAEYPMGNGLGGGGTSIPFFLQDLIHNPIGLENEYSRILLEQGLMGLGLWVAFLIWTLSRSAPPKNHPWFLCWRLLWYYTLCNFLMGLLGIGLMTSIPHTILLFLGMGFMFSLSRPAPVTPSGFANRAASAPVPMSTWSAPEPATIR